MKDQPRDRILEILNEKALEIFPIALPDMTSNTINSICREAFMIGGLTLINIQNDEDLRLINHRQKL